MIDGLCSSTSISAIPVLPEAWIGGPPERGGAHGTRNDKTIAGCAWSVIQISLRGRAVWTFSNHGQSPMEAISHLQLVAQGGTVAGRAVAFGIESSGPCIYHPSERGEDTRGLTWMLDLDWEAKDRPQARDVVVRKLQRQTLPQNYRGREGGYVVE